MAKAEESLGWVLLGTMAMFAVVAYIARRTYQPEA